MTNFAKIFSPIILQKLLFKDFCKHQNDTTVRHDLTVKHFANQSLYVQEKVVFLRANLERQWKGDSIINVLIVRVSNIHDLSIKTPPAMRWAVDADAAKLQLFKSFQFPVAGK